ncbi:MAG: RNA chaperone Hfq [Armatimonadetes bacterium]|nr:RNA chaperone Hfq [Armatimonadota bacterium]
MAKSTPNVQEAFLNLCRHENVRCIVYLVNGVQLRGFVRAFDNFTILLEDDQRQQMIYKHAVTTVQPMARMPEGLRWADDKPETEES